MKTDRWVGFFLCYNSKVFQSRGIIMKKRLFLMALLLISQATWAARILPNQIQLAVLQQVNYPQVVLSGDGITWTEILTLGLVTPTVENGSVVGLRIRDTNNRFITKNKLPQYVGHPVGVFFNQDKQINEIWILTPQERATLKARGQ